jgi:3-oxoacyl-[acyl-carrier protein] reductase
MKLEDLRCVVTGGGSGMGRHFSLALARAGARVAALDIEPKGLEALAVEAAGAGLAGELRTYRVNVADEVDAGAGVERAWAELGPLNALVNNAGIFRDGLLVRVDKQTGKLAGKLSRAEWQAVIDVDLTGPFLMTRELVARMVDAGVRPGVIINISSVSRHGNMGQSNYSAAKAGLVADTKLWAEELARYGIRVGAVAPGFIRTPILEGMRPEMLDRMVSKIPLRRLGEAEEVFAGIRFIVECDYFTGRCLDIDGGVVL